MNVSGIAFPGVQSGERDQGFQTKFVFQVTTNAGTLLRPSTHENRNQAPRVQKSLLSLVSDLSISFPTSLQSKNLCPSQVHQCNQCNGTLCIH